MATTVHTKTLALYADTPRVATGSTGARLLANLSVLTTSSTWVDSEAVAALKANGYGVPQDGDAVTLYNSTGTFAETRHWNGTTWGVSLPYTPNGVYTKASIYAEGQRDYGGLLAAIVAKGQVGTSLGFICDSGAEFNPVYSAAADAYSVRIFGNFYNKALQVTGNISLESGSITQSNPALLNTGLNADLLDGKHANEFTQADTAHTYKFDGATTTGSATATFLNNKPGTNQNVVWIKLIIDGNTGYVPWVPA